MNALTQPAVALHDGRLMADSRDVATFFRKEHRRVLQTIREVHCSAEFRRHNFVPFKNKDLTGESTSHVLMTKNGFAFLVLGFTGAEAGVFKEAYIERFDAMEAELQSRSAPAVPQSLPEALRLAADLAEKVERQDRAIAVLVPRSKALAAIAEGEGTFCIRDAAKLLQMPEGELRGYLIRERWIYRREADGCWVPFATRERPRWMTTKLVPVEISPGKTWNRPQARVTSAGLTILAQRLARSLPRDWSDSARAS